MNQADIVQKLINEVVTQRGMLYSLLDVLAVQLDPDDPDERRQKLVDAWVASYKLHRPHVEAEMAANWGIPLSQESQLDQGPGPEFDAWLRRGLGE
jgi:hypothetical protein